MIWVCPQSNVQLLQSQYIEQLKQLHQLLELTALTKAEYEQQNDIILDKMKLMLVTMYYPNITE